jgi:hypothetical protein
MRAALAVLALAAACDSYDPSLSDQPFRCGDSSPRCPGGYTCVEHSPERKVCERKGASADQPDGGSDSADACRDDFEPNDEMALAQLTAVSELADRARIDELTLCPGGDRDLYGFTLRRVGTPLRVTVTGTRAVDLAIVNESGVVVDTGTDTGRGVVELRLPRATAPGGLAPATYFVRVSSAGPAEVPYSLDIVTCADTTDPSCLE